MRATSGGCFARNAAVNHRSITAGAINFIPFFRSVAIRSFQLSSVPIFAAVLQRINFFSRCCAFAPSHIPVCPPIDRPQKFTLSKCRKSSKETTSRPKVSIEYGPGGADDCPCPRLSYRSTRYFFAISVSCEFHSETSVPSEFENTSTGADSGPLNSYRIRAPLISAKGIVPSNPEFISPGLWPPRSNNLSS